MPITHCMQFNRCQHISHSSVDHAQTTLGMLPLTSRYASKVKSPLLRVSSWGLSGKAREKIKKTEQQIPQIGTDLLAAEAPSLPHPTESSAVRAPRRLQCVVRLFSSNRLFQKVKRHRPLRLLYTIVPIAPVALEVRVRFAVQTDVALV